MNPDNLSKRFTRPRRLPAGTAARHARESQAYVRDLRRRHGRGHAPGRAALARALRPQDDVRYIGVLDKRDAAAC